jgi:hypothetical protein
MLVNHGEAKLVLKKERAGWHLTERAANLTMAISFDDFPEVGVIPVTLHGIARVAKVGDSVGVITGNVSRLILQKNVE